MIWADSLMFLVIITLISLVTDTSDTDGEVLHLTQIIDKTIVAESNIIPTSLLNKMENN